MNSGQEKCLEIIIGYAYISVVIIFTGKNNSANKSGVQKSGKYFISQSCRYLGDSVEILPGCFHILPKLPPTCCAEILALRNNSGGEYGYSQQ